MATKTTASSNSKKKLKKSEEKDEELEQLLNSLERSKELITAFSEKHQSNNNNNNNKSSSTMEEELEMTACPEKWKNNISQILYSKSKIDQRVKELADEINSHYSKIISDKDEPLIVVGLLTGAICFMTDLVRQLKVNYVMDFMVLSSYHGTSSKGTVELKKDLNVSPAGRHILIVEDIIDTGGTLSWLNNFLMTKDAKSIKVAVLLDKKPGRTVQNSKVKVDYCGFVC